MRRLGAYGVACAALVLVVAGGASPVLDERQRAGLWLSGAAALGLQVLGFAARMRWGTTPTRLLAAWAWSTGARFTGVLGMALAVWRYEGLDVVMSLVGLAGFLFVMLLMEPAFTLPVPHDLDDGEIARG